MTTTEISNLLGEALTRRDGNRWITADDIIITEGIKSGGHPMIHIECIQCGASGWSHAAGAAMKLDQIRNDYHA